MLSLPTDDIPTRFTDNQRTALEDYKEYLMADIASCAADVEKFQMALSSVLFRQQGFKIDTVGRLGCPAQSYIAILSLRGTGQFVKAGLVTQPISRLLYLSRSAVLHTALHDHKDADFMQ